MSWGDLRAHSVGTRGLFPHQAHGVGSRGLYLPIFGMVTIGEGGQILFLSAPAQVDYLTEEDQVAALFLSPLVQKIVTEGAVIALTDSPLVDYDGIDWQVLYLGDGEEAVFLGSIDQVLSEQPDRVNLDDESKQTKFDD